MNYRKLNNPFPVIGYQGEEYFCDRQKETSLLINNIMSGISTTTVSVRRMGKTGLINHVLAYLPKEAKGIYIDILETENLSQFLNTLATSLLQAFPGKSSLGKKTWEFIRSIRPVITFDPLTGAPKATFDLHAREAEQSIDNIFAYVDRLNLRIVIAIDEFQQVMKYPEKNTDAWLRSRIQQLKNVVFIFSGSQQHLMTELFSSPQRPFFRSTSLLKLDKLDFEVYRDFIVAMFHNYNKEISPLLTEEILKWCNTHTFYVQQICNRVFTATSKGVSRDLWKKEAHDILREQEIVFFGYRNLLTVNQWKLLKAIAAEGKVYQPNNMTFLSKYSLMNASTVTRSLKSLQKYELVYSDYGKEGVLYYSVYDVFFQRWCENQ